MYVTTSAVYALRYAKSKPEDSVTACKYVTQFKIADHINLFNARAQKDQKNLIKVCTKTIPEFSFLVEKLRKNSRFKP